MSLSYDLFDALRSFDNVRRLNREEYLKWAKAHEQYKGSEGYSKDRAEAERKRKAADDSAREAAEKKIFDCLKRMKENAGSVALVPPTPEQIAILQVLSMRTSMTRAELESAAQSMNGNALCLSALNDIADKHFPKTDTKNVPLDMRYHNNYLKYAKGMSSGAVEKTLEDIAYGIRDILKSPVKAHILERAEINKNKFGNKYHIDDLPQREELVSERQFYNDYVSAEQYDDFMKAVNGQ